MAARAYRGGWQDGQSAEPRPVHADLFLHGGCVLSTNLPVKYKYKYKYSKDLTIRGAIVNRFDAAPPVDLNTYGGTGANGSSGGSGSGSGAPYNPSLHQAGAIGRYISIGLDYKL